MMYVIPSLSPEDSGSGTGRSGGADITPSEPRHGQRHEGQDGDDQRLDVGPGGDDDVLTGVEELARERHAPIMSPGAPGC